MKLSKLDIEDAIHSHYTATLPRLRRLRDYYGGRHQILTETKEAGKPNNRLVCNFCRTITDSTVGYFMGMPLEFSADDSLLAETVAGINSYNDEQFAESRIAHDLSVTGRACEILWFDSDGMIRFAPVDITGCIPFYSDGVEHELTAAIRLCEQDGRAIVEVYEDDSVSSLYYSPESGTVAKFDETESNFGQVPVNFYSNNAAETGDFEPVLTLVDAYNRLQSESVNDFDLFADSYLAITGMGGTRPEDIEALRRERVLLLDDGGSAHWLTKPDNGDGIELLKSRIARDIYRFSGTVDLSEEILGGGQLSGAAIRYRMTSFENRVSVTERYFKKALQRRYELICGSFASMGRSFDYRKINVKFNRNLPAESN